MTDTMDYGKHSPFTFREGEWLDSMPDLEDINPGQTTMDRMTITTSNVTTASQSLRLTYFTAIRSELINSVSISCGSTAAAATPTLIRIGLYTVASNGDLTLVASTPNDTTLFSSAFVVYTKAFSTSYTLVKGQKYAVGVLVVSAVGVPNFYGNGSIPTAFLAKNPRVCGQVNSQADLPANLTAGSILDNNLPIFAILQA